MYLFNIISDFIVGPCFRNIESTERTIYLTFDDGPNSFCTPKVLDLLKKYNAKATFFVVGNNIEKNMDVFNRIITEGHSIGNHSIDHNMTTLFKGKSALNKMIYHGEEIITRISGKPSVGYRPPVGIRTPELRLIMKQKNEKPIMWQHRFYDTKKGFTKKAWERKFHKIKSGDIILLHDTHKQADVFLTSLDGFIKKLVKDGFQHKAIHKINPI